MELLKQVLDDRTDLFQKDYLNPSFEAIFGKGLLAANGDDWKRHHQVVHPIFKYENLKVNCCFVGLQLVTIFDRLFVLVYSKTFGGSVCVSYDSRRHTKTD